MGGAIALLSAGVLAGGCGNDDTVEKPRPPMREVVTGVVRDDAVWLRAAEKGGGTGAGPVTITIDNQTDVPRTITLEGETTRESVGPVAPSDAATIARTLEPGRYVVSAGSGVAQPSEPRPAVLTVGPERSSSNSELLLP